MSLARLAQPCHRRAFAGFQQMTDQRADSDRIAFLWPTRSNVQNACVEAFDLFGRLVGLETIEHVPGATGSPSSLSQPRKTASVMLQPSRVMVMAIGMFTSFSQ